MKKFSLLYPILILFLFPCVSACIDIQLGKTDYFPYETFQAEITGDFARALDNSNIFFYQDNKELSILFKREQIAANKYIVYANLPLKYGNYKFALKNILCIENRTTRTVSKESQFTVSKPVSQAYNWLSGKTATWPSVDDGGAFALMALAYDDALAQKGKAALIAVSRDNGTCWPSSSCNVKSTALAILALNKLRAVDKNWLFDSQNNIEIGGSTSWELIVNSDSDKQCNLTINEQPQIINLKSGNNIFTLPLPDDPEIIIGIDCDVVSAFVSHTYLGTVNKFFSAQNTFTLNNRKCFGPGYRQECSAESTAYALWALFNLGIKDSIAEEWLKGNVQGTAQRSIAFILTSDDGIKEWLINNQAPQGYWSRDALAFGNESSVEATVLAIEALKSETDALSVSAVDKAKAWLLQKFSSSSQDNFGSLYETSLVLSMIFKPEQIEPLVSIGPAVFKTRSNNNLTLEISNNGITNVNGILSFEGKTIGSFSVNKSSSKQFIFTAPSKTQTAFTAFDLQYSAIKANRTYSIPLLLWPAAITEPEIKQNVEEEKVEESILPVAIKFLETGINETVSAGSSLHVNIFNPSSESAEVTILPSWDLLSENVISITPDKFILAANKTMEITLSVQNRTGVFAGTIDAKTSTSSASIHLTLNIVAGAEEEKSCSELGGKICASVEKCNVNVTYTKGEFCCVGACEKKIEEKKTSSNLMWGIIILAVLIIGIILFLRLRLKKKPKKEIGEELKKIEEQYMQRLGGQTGRP